MKHIFPTLMVFFLLTGCSTPNAMAFFAIETSTPVPSATAEPTVTPLATKTRTPQPAPTPIELGQAVTATLSPTATATPALTVKGPGSITCPILLYHHIQAADVPNDYYVTPEKFRAQMQALKDWGYTPIPISLLVKAINFGAPLPDRPVVISFDDGDTTVYTTAFPIMQEFGFVGVNYLVGNRLNIDGFISTAQVKELIAAGWEVGSHSMTHADLAQSTEVGWELSQSKADIEKALDVKVETFAYPFGSQSERILNKVSKVYTSGVGLGIFMDQKPDNIYYLWRRPVYYGADMAAFASYVPWNTPPGQP